MNLGDKIKELRKSKGITQEQLSDMLNVSSQAVSKWETGATNPDLALIPDIAKLFDVSADELLGIEKNKETSSNIENDVINARLDRLEKMLGLLSAKDDSEALGIVLDNAKKVYSVDFTKLDDFKKTDWEVGCSELLETKNKFVFKATPVNRVVGKNFDPIVVNDKVCIDASKVSKILIKVKTNVGINDGDALAKYIVQSVCGNDAEKLQKANIILNQYGGNMANIQQNFGGKISVSNCFMNFYFITDNNSVWSESLKLQSFYRPNEITTVWFDTNQNFSWNGKITGIRIDPVEKIPARVELYGIVMLDNNGEVVYEYNFTNNEGVEESEWQLSNAEKLESDDCLKFDVVQSDITVTGYDPMVYNENIKVDVSKAKYLHVRFKAVLDRELYDCRFQIYFKTEAYNSFSEIKKISVNYQSGCFGDYYVDLSKNGYWNGVLTGIRLDPIEGVGGTFEVELVEILEAEKTVGVGGKLTNIEERLANIEDMLDDLEGMYSELESRLDDLE